MYVSALNLKWEKNNNKKELRYDPPKKCRKWRKGHFFQIALEVASPNFLSRKEIALETFILNLYVFDMIDTETTITSFFRFNDRHPL